MKPTESEDLNAIILWVLRFIFQAASTKGTQYNRAYKHARTLQGYARDGVPTEEVEAKLAEEGADYAFRHETKKNPRRTRGQGGSKTAQRDESSSDEDQVDDDESLTAEGFLGGKWPQEDPDDASGDDDPDDEEGPAPKRDAKGPPAAPKRGPAGSTVSADTETVEPSILEVEVAEEELDAIIEAIKKGERPRITIERVKIQSKGKWIRVRACEIEYE